MEDPAAFRHTPSIEANEAEFRMWLIQPTAGSSTGKKGWLHDVRFVYIQPADAVEAAVVFWHAQSNIYPDTGSAAICCRVIHCRGYPFFCCS